MTSSSGSIGLFCDSCVISVRLIPVSTTLGFNNQRYTKLGRCLHARFHFPDKRHHLLLRHLEHQLIVYLHHHAGIEVALLQPVFNIDHGALDDIRSRALHGRIDRGAFGGLATVAVLGAYLRQIKATPEYRFNKAILGGLGTNTFHVACHAGITVEVAVDISLRLVALQVQLSRKTPGAHAVDQAEVDRLDTAPLLAADLLQWHAEYFGSGSDVNVAPFGKRRKQPLIS